ncbi:MAG: M23 family metallopeptidase [Prevotella sp.]|nr:M23 family metallopeptidase [Prevotella sp.]
MVKIRSLLLSFAVAITTTASTPVKQQFSAAEQQQISIATPGLFKSYDAFNFDFGTLRDNDYSFPLPVGKATARKNGSVEIVTKEGDAVKAMFEGTVRLSRKTPDLGNAIVIRHRNGLETVYGNNAENLVDVGAHVKAGQTIAIVGERDGKVYCDFSIMVNGGRINPTSVVNLKNHHLKRQTLLFEKDGAYVNVTALGDKSEFEETEEEMKLDELFAKSNTFKWNLEKMREEAWAYPLPGAKVISPYGGKRRHSGVDLKTKPNDEIHAAFDGVVMRSGPHYGYGNCIVIRHSNGLETLYSHQSRNLVKVGDKVKAGQVIGLTGRTGRATTEHLHFETHFKGRRFNPNLIFDHNSKQLQKSTITFTKGGGVTSKQN